MFRKILFTLFVLSCAAAFSACKPTGAAATPQPNLPNPASVYCEQNGGRLEIRTDASGGQAGICIFPNGSECDEWAYYHKECAPGRAASPEPNMANPASVYCEQNGGRLEIRTDASGGQAGICIFPDGSECDEWAYFHKECSPKDEASQPAGTDGWQVYRDEALGYQFEYPAGAQIVPGDDPLDSLVIEGTSDRNERWPQITISHPAARDEFRPPEGADLAQWLADHNLEGEPRQADAQIAGTTALHFRHERSPQSYAFDRYYFAHGDQLFMIVIGHVGDQEDWEVYNRFLDSFSFTE